MPEMMIVGKKEMDEVQMAKEARKQFPIPKNCCPDKRRRIMKLRENYVIYLKKCIS